MPWSWRRWIATIASFKMTPKSSGFTLSILNYFKNKKLCACSSKKCAVHSFLLPKLCTLARPFTSSLYWRNLQYNGQQVVVLAVVLTGFPLVSPRLFNFSRVFLQQNYRKCRRTEKIPTEKPSYWQFYTFASTTPLYPVRRVQRLHRTIVILETRSFRSIALIAFRGLSCKLF